MRYTEEHINWIRLSQGQEWKNMKAFTDAFNLKFGLRQSATALSSAMKKRGIILNSKCNNGFYTQEQKEWIVKNLNIIEWKNQKHFTDTFNALFGTHKTVCAMNTYLFKNGLNVKTVGNTNHWTSEMDAWLKNHYAEYDCYFVKMAKDFNAVFGTDKSGCCIAKHLEREGIHKPSPKRSGRNRGMFQKGAPSKKGELPLGTIRYNSDGRPFIKVKMCNGEAAHEKNGCHNYREPWWKPLQKKIWEDHYGEVPDGYVVCTLSCDPNDTDVNHIGIIDKRGTARMAKNDWWGIDNVQIKKTAVQWCNLFYVAQDHEVDLKGV